MRLENISFNYEQKPIIEQLNLTIPKQQITTIIGPNGSGKSTLLHLLANLLKPKSGNIYIEQSNIASIKLKEFAKKVAIVNQRNTVGKDELVKSIVAYGRLPYLKFTHRYTKEDYEIISWAMEVTGISDIQNEKMGNLSGGQSQRVWIAMALAQNTDILLLDEPTTYLDIKYQYELLELISTLNKQYHKTIIMVLHDLNQALHYSDYLIAMKSGKVLFAKSTKEDLNIELFNKLYETPLQWLIQDKTKYLMPLKHQ